jgi:ABC-type lipoprotein release transport system permease subunit
MTFFQITTCIFLGTTAICIIILAIVINILKNKNSEIYRINKQTEIDKENYRHALKEKRHENKEKIDKENDFDNLVKLGHDMLSNR